MPREKLLDKLEPERIYIPIFSLETSLTIPYGAPVCFKMDASTNGSSPGATITNDGLGVVLPETGAAIKAHAFFAGIARGNVSGRTDNTIPINKRGLAQVFGICISTVLVLSTRATTTDVWASQAAYAVGDLLQVQTVAGLQGMSDVGSVAATSFLPYAVNAGFTQASVTTTASSAYSTFSAATVMTTSGKVFLRAM